MAKFRGRSPNWELNASGMKQEAPLSQRGRAIDRQLCLCLSTPEAISHRDSTATLFVLIPVIITLPAVQNQDIGYHRLKQLWDKEIWDIGVQWHVKNLNQKFSNCPPSTSLKFYLNNTWLTVINTTAEYYVMWVRVFLYGLLYSLVV